VTVNDLRHLAAAGRVVCDDAEVVDGAARQVVVHQTDSAVSTRRSTTATSLAGSLELHHVLCTRHTQNAVRTSILVQQQTKLAAYQHFNPLDAHCCHVGTAIVKHPVPD